MDDTVEKIVTEENKEVEQPDPNEAAALLKKLGLGELKINTPDEKIMSNIRTNIKRGLPGVFPKNPNDEEVIVVGGGWSLDDTFEELREAYWNGAKVIAVNNTGRWLMEHNIRPSALVVMDARATNLRFVEIDPPGCKFFLASQCDSALFEAVQDKDAYIYHVWTTGTEEEEQILKDYYLGNYTIIPGTCCVTFRAIMMFRMLGFQWFKLFGCDSCYAPSGKHHAYEQPENENESTSKFNVGGRVFTCSAWQIAQAVHFLELVKHQGDKIKLEVFGDGLLSHMVKTGANPLGKGD